MLNVRFQKRLNKIANQEIVSANLVNLNKIDFNTFCKFMSDGTSLTKSDVSAVMTRFVDLNPSLLNTNSYIDFDGQGSYVRPTVSGSLSASQYKQQQLDSGKSEDECKSLTCSALKTSDLTAGISITLSKDVVSAFKPEWKRVGSDNQAGETEEDVEDDSTTSSSSRE